MARISYVELPSARVGPSERFYAEAFGWKMESFGPTYACTMSGEVDLGLQGDASEATMAPLVVIEVESLGQAIGAVRVAGGTITREPFSFPGGRRFHFVDPSGNELAALEVDKASAAEER